MLAFQAVYVFRTNLLTGTPAARVFDPALATLPTVRNVLKSLNDDEINAAYGVSEAFQAYTVCKCVLCVFLCVSLYCVLTTFFQNCMNGVHSVNNVPHTKAECVRHNTFTVGTTNFFYFAKTHVYFKRGLTPDKINEIIPEMWQDAVRLQLSVADPLHFPSGPPEKLNIRVAEKYFII